MAVAGYFVEEKYDIVPCDKSWGVRFRELWIGAPLADARSSELRISMPRNMDSLRSWLDTLNHERDVLNQKSQLERFGSFLTGPTVVEEIPSAQDREILDRKWQIVTNAMADLDAYMTAHPGEATGTLKEGHNSGGPRPKSPA